LRISHETEKRLRVLAGGAAGPFAGPLPAAVARLIDHTLLKAEVTAERVRAVCAEARQYSFAAVCVNSVWVDLVAEELAGTDVRPCSVVGFPLGASPAMIKIAETHAVVSAGAREVDMVIQIGALREGDETTVLEEISAVTEAAHLNGALCKVILETAFLDDAQKRRGCALAIEGGADFVKTSTGYGPGGATVADVALLAEAVRTAGLGVKAAGGIRDLESCLAMITAGATRIGSSASVAIMEQAAKLEVKR
jgi:deoxyribose-phosphate aldolase